MYPAGFECVIDWLKAEAIQRSVESSTQGKKTRVVTWSSPKSEGPRPPTNAGWSLHGTGRLPILLRYIAGYFIRSGT